MPRIPEAEALLAFLDLLERDINDHPERIKPFPRDLMERAASLVEGIEVDLNGPLTGED